MKNKNRPNEGSTSKREITKYGANSSGGNDFKRWFSYMKEGSYDGGDAYYYDNTPFA